MILPVDELPTAPNKLLTALSSLADSGNFSWSDAHVLVALSGGLDSVCMLRLLSICKQLLDFNIRVIHFNHGLRGVESDLDKDFCLQLCKSLDFEVDIINLEINKNSSNLQAIAREQRKRYYDEWKHRGAFYLVATAHHKDDFIESFFIGVHQGRLDERLIPLKLIDFSAQFLRPLVLYSKFELLELAIKKGWQWREDSSNSKVNYLRNFYRKILLTDSDLVASVSNITDSLVSLDFELRAWLDIQLKRFEERGSYLDRDECIRWEDSRFRDFWLAVLQDAYPEFLSSFDAKRLKQVRIAKYRGNRRFHLGSNPTNSTRKLILVETLRGYHLELE